MTTLSRRDFTRLLALTGSASLLPDRAFAQPGFDPAELGLTAAPLPPTPLQPDEKFWVGVRARFLVPRDVAFLNAANICPASLPAIEACEKNLRLYEVNPSPETRTMLLHAREDARKLLAEMLRATPGEIVITRNTTEGNNFVSSGLQLGPGDEVIVSEDNHPSNLGAWRTKAQRFGFTVVSVPTPARHPGPDGYVASFVNAMTPRTKVLAIQYVSSNSGDVLPVAELCRVARERGILSLVDSAQAFGVIDVDLSTVKPDFFTGSLHKWPCGPKEKGVLFVNKDVHDRLWPSVVGVYAGQVGISRKMEGHGQRDDASVAAVVEALKFNASIGGAAIEKRARSLAQYLMVELRKLDGVQLWTDPDPSRSAAIVIFRPGSLDVRKLNAALTEKEKIVVTTRAGDHNPGLRISTHYFNTMEDVERTVGAIRKYMASGV